MAKEKTLRISSTQCRISKFGDPFRSGVWGHYPRWLILFNCGFAASYCDLPHSLLFATILPTAEC